MSTSTVFSNNKSQTTYQFGCNSKQNMIMPLGCVTNSVSVSLYLNQLFVTPPT